MTLTHDEFECIRPLLEDLACELDPNAKSGRFTISSDPWPAHLAEHGVYFYTDAQGTLHFTLGFDRRGPDEPA
jgi:hypothetical protein